MLFYYESKKKQKVRGIKDGRKGILQKMKEPFFYLVLSKGLPYLRSGCYVFSIRPKPAFSLSKIFFLIFRKGLGS